MTHPGTPALVAAVDLGSNSFHCLIGRVEQSSLGIQVYPLDSLKETVRLAGGLGEDQRLDPASQRRAIVVLQRFGERLRSFSPDRVRVVATNTLRVATNAQDFIQTAEAALGFPIEVISGHEEARLIHMGVAHSLPRDGRKRLVVDIGGGSTEFIVGIDDRPLLLESVYIGCVRHSREFFAGGLITGRNFKAAVLAARKEIQVIAKDFRQTGWDEAVGSSGTAKAILEVLASAFQEPQISLAGLERLSAHLVRAGRADDAHFSSLKQDRLPVFAAGVAIMTAIFEELGVGQMRYGEGALRLGVLYDLIGRSQSEDMRSISVEQAMQRYLVDQAQARRVGELASLLWQGVACGALEEVDEVRQRLVWAACLHEVGRSISHNSFHRHSAYIIQHADLPGFSKQDQQALAQLLFGQTGKLSKMATELVHEAQRASLLCFRLACLMHRRREDIKPATLRLVPTKKGYSLELSADWLAQHPLTEYSLGQEREEWARLGIDLQLQPCLDEAGEQRRSSAGA
jgi:exopolyphosphatase/guanosine-5'-triphosphate,3'-diphosphate pyrophosphatase